MNDLEFFRNSACDCRRMARAAASDHVRWQLLLFAREFDQIAEEGEAAFVRDRDGALRIRALFDRLIGRNVDDEFTAAD